MSELSKLLKERNVEGWSAREVARRAQWKGHSISEPTATALFGGRHGEPRPETLRAVAAVLPVTMEELRSAAGLPPETRIWEPPEEANLLAPEVQDGIADLIKAIARQGGQHEARHAEA